VGFSLRFGLDQDSIKTARVRDSRLCFLLPSTPQRKPAPLNPFAIAALLLLIAALGLRWFQRRNAWLSAGEPWPFYARRALPGYEQVLYQRLVSALPEYRVLSRVPVSSVLGVRRGHDAQTWTRRIRHLQYDLVVCAQDATVLAAIELQDSARRGETSTSADRIIERASNAAGVPLMHWQASALPEHAEIRAVFGLPLTQVFEEVASSANQSWWPPLSSARRNTPAA
jgi:hypothetical protein